MWLFCILILVFHEHLPSAKFLILKSYFFLSKHFLECNQLSSVCSRSVDTGTERRYFLPDNVCVPILLIQKSNHSCWKSSLVIIVWESTPYFRRFWKPVPRCALDRVESYLFQNTAKAFQLEHSLKKHWEQRIRVVIGHLCLIDRLQGETHSFWINGTGKQKTIIR